MTLKGYDLFSVGQFRAALQEAVLPAAAGQAGLAPAILASIRSLELGEAHEAVATNVLKGALDQALATKVWDVATPSRVASFQLAQAQLICDEDAVELRGDCMMTIPDTVPPGGVPAERNDGRGVENYSG
jgi:hypothetical protein